MMVKNLALERDRKKDAFHTGKLNHGAVNHLKQDWSSERSMNSHFGKGEVG